MPVLRGVVVSTDLVLVFRDRATSSRGVYQRFRCPQRLNIDT